MLRLLFNAIVLSFTVLILFGVISPSSAQSAGYDWVQWNGDAQHGGNNTAETQIRLDNVKRLRQRYQITLPDVVDGAVLYLRNVNTQQGIKDLLFMTSKPGDLFALEAQTGKMVWMQPHHVTNCFVDQNELQKVGEKLACWTASIPAIDPSHTYIYSYGLDGYVHKHQVGDGREIVTNGWPQMVTRKPWLDKISSALTIATGRNSVNYLYVTTSGYPKPEPGDWGDYQGHLVTINLIDNTAQVFNAMCSNVQQLFVERPDSPTCPEKKAGIWARGGISYFADTDRIYMATGNGTFDPSNHYWADSVLALNPDGSGIKNGPLDNFSPANFQELRDTDADLAVYLPLIVPLAGSSKYPYVIVQGGKDGYLRVLNPADLSGTHEAGHVGGELAPLVKIPFDAEITTSPGIWINPVDRGTWIVTPTYLGMAAWRLNSDQSGNPSLTLMWKNDKPCTSPLIANNVIFCAAFKNIWAFDPTTGQQVWGVYPIGDIHWESPVVANGRLYITDEAAHLTVYALN